MAEVNASNTIPGVQASPISGFPRPGRIPIPNMTVTTDTLTTAGGVRTATAEELLGGLFLLDVDDAQTMTLPSAADLVEAIPGATGTAQNTGACGFRFLIKNTGDSTLTVDAGAGGTMSGTSTVITAELREFIVVITNAARGSETYTCYDGLHSTF